MAKNKKISLWVIALIVIVIWIIFALCYPTENVHAPENPINEITPETNNTQLYCDDWTLCELPEIEKIEKNDTNKLVNAWTTKEEKPYPEISREDAKSLIKEGSIYSATQTHNKTVVLELKNRFLYQTKEPNIDDIFKIIEDCWKLCDDIIMATE